MDIDLTTRFLDDLTTLGVTLPEATANARDIYDAGLAAAQRMPAAALQDALTAGEITPDNVGEKVFQAALDQTAQQNAYALVNSLRSGLNRAINQGLREDRDRIHAELKAAFDPAAAAITKAAQHFGPDTTTDEVVTLKPEAVKMWNQVTGHSTTLDAVSAAYRRLLSDVLRELPAAIVSLFVAGPADLDHADNVYRTRNRWLALAHEGFTLNLNTTEQAQRVVGQAEQVKAEQAAAERALHLAEHRRKYMPIAIPTGQV